MIRIFSPNRHRGRNSNRSKSKGFRPSGEVDPPRAVRSDAVCHTGMANSAIADAGANGEHCPSLDVLHERHLAQALHHRVVVHHDRGIEITDPRDRIRRSIAGEGAFLACSFWLADVYVLQERWNDAERLFKRLIGLANDVGLLSEEFHLAERRLVGNFPQAFSHVAPIKTASNLTRAKMPVGQRSEQPDKVDAQ